MRTRQFRTLALCCLLAFSFSAIPVVAAPRGHNGGDDRDLPGISRVIKQMKRFIMAAFDTLTLPNP
jgi:hypothetical protein